MCFPILLDGHLNHQTWSYLRVDNPRPPFCIIPTGLTLSKFDPTTQNPTQIAVAQGKTLSTAAPCSVHRTSTGDSLAGAPSLGNHFDGSIAAQGEAPVILERGDTRGSTIHDQLNPVVLLAAPNLIPQFTTPGVIPEEAHSSLTPRDLPNARAVHIGHPHCHGHIINHCRVGATPMDTVVTQASKSFVTPTLKPVVDLANKPVDALVHIVVRAGKGKENEVVVEVLRQWVLVAGSSSVVAIPPPVVHVGPTL
ncbi:Uncharacterized protein Adt_06704 [Abeliophyllum distichum]|uniref:Uncharacterized protein n=1 Tax=Abeliophyllum distichum TaxID=126358 RepID=A0ABD1V7M5_9LAMI